MFAEMVRVLDAEAIKRLQATVYEQDLRNCDEKLTLTKELNTTIQNQKKEIH